MPDFYEIKFKGQFAPLWSEWFAGLEMTQLDDGITLLAGQIEDQAALHGLLKRIRDLNLTLISVSCKNPPSPKNRKGVSNEDD
jgi:hypothetical protein